MEITVNGQLETVSPCSLAELVTQKKLQKESLIVEHNMTIIKQPRWAEVQLQDGDTVELLSFVGGG